MSQAGVRGVEKACSRAVIRPGPEARDQRTAESVGDIAGGNARGEGEAFADQRDGGGSGGSGRGRGSGEPAEGKACEGRLDEGTA